MRVAVKVVSSPEDDHVVRVGVGVRARVAVLVRVGVLVFVGVCVPFGEGSVVCVRVGVAV